MPDVPPPGMFTIDLCDWWNQRLAEAPAATFDGVTRNLAPGEWRLTGALDALQFAPGKTILDVRQVRVVVDNAIQFTGYVTPVASGVGGLDIVDADIGPQFTLSGADEWSVIAQRVAYPTPGSEPPWADAWDIRTGQASSVAAEYLLYNLGPYALTNREMVGIGVVDGHAGTTGEWSARLQPLDQLVTRICHDGGIVCRLGTAFTGGITITLVAPEDRSRSTVLSDQGGLTAIQQTRTTPTSTFVIAGGQGALTSRTFATSAEPFADHWERRETFTDQSSLSTVGELQQAADTVRALALPTLTVIASITDDAAAAIIYLADYDVGDTIAIEIGDVRYPVIVEAVTIHVSPDRAMIRPVFGSASPNIVTGLVRDVAAISTRLDTQIT